MIETEKSERKNKRKKSKKSTYEVTLEIYRTGKGIKEIAKEHGLTEGTILTHIEALISHGRIERKDFEKYISQKLRKDIPAIIREFKRLDTDKLSLVRESFGEKYSYDEIRLARMMMD